MIKIKHPQELARLRRLALSAQGLLQTQAFGSGLAGACNAINHIGYVQIDAISVVERAHHHILNSRVPNFKPAMTNQLLLNKDIFEYWSHAAAFLPIKDFRFSLPYKHAIKNGQIHWHKERDSKLMQELLTRIRIDGPLRSRDLESNATKRAGWWDWKPAKKALEQLYMEGDLMVSNREGFQKTYDLTERVLPSEVNLKMPSMDELATHIVDQQFRCLGVTSLKGLTYLRRDNELRNAVKNLVDERLVQNILQQVQMSSGEILLVETEAIERPLPRLNNRMLILSPFDNSAIQRDRLKLLFQYNYQLECYVPAVKRQYGYFCLPLLYRGEFVGRMDCKVHRKTSHLEIKSLHFEQHNFEQHNFDQASVITAFVDAIIPFCSFQKCDSVSLIEVYPKPLNEKLQSALKSIINVNIGPII
ncbi:YcaQ family DNA glycosylase [Pseudoalteromonas sp. SWYJ118]|uniref:winged helix-turn-helix domain-containing protein n=1 Tax=Pseudoalteromonas sp. SWYJ118 TaxID=2792062 RepID=UPI0018CF4376|nr:crosslink repair DNA glycosylase YcaQ family protein [Pseudoalteromonas sp. SWYJ118]MBH0076599.1 YcaQ family DNA glycosylase [Pseudoalteromonas sp. SWYJ118]